MTIQIQTECLYRHPRKKKSSHTYHFHPNALFLDGDPSSVFLFKVASTPPTCIGQDNQSKLWWSNVSIWDPHQKNNCWNHWISTKKCTLWWTNIAMEHHHFYWENPLFLWPFSIAMLNSQRVKAVGNSSKRPRGVPKKTPRPRLNVARAMYICTSVDPSGKIILLAVERWVATGDVPNLTQEWKYMEIYGNT